MHALKTKPFSHEVTYPSWFFSLQQSVLTSEQTVCVFLGLSYTKLIQNHTFVLSAPRAPTSVPLSPLPQTPPSTRTRVWMNRGIQLRLYERSRTTQAQP